MTSVPHVARIESVFTAVRFSGVALVWPVAASGAA